MAFRLPKYRLHKGSGQALVQINGGRIYLGKFGTEESKEEYRRQVAEFLAGGVPRGTDAESSHSIGPPTSINELILAFWQHAKKRYVKRGRPTSEIHTFVPHYAPCGTSTAASL
jgi:hypothetical protein